MKLELGIAAVALGAIGVGYAQELVRYAQSVPLPVGTAWTIGSAVVVWAVSAEVRLRTKANAEDLREVRGQVVEMRSDYATDRHQFLPVLGMVSQTNENVQEANEATVRTEQAVSDMAASLRELTAALVKDAKKGRGE